MGVKKTLICDGKGCDRREEFTSGTDLYNLNYGGGG